jgi:hypothetical protein
MSQITHERNGTFTVSFTYNEEFKDWLKDTVHWKERKYNGDRTWSVAGKHFKVIKAGMEKHFGYCDVVGSPSSDQGGRRVDTFTLDYLGALKERDGGIYTAYGCIGSQFDAVFTKEAIEKFFQTGDLSDPISATSLYAVLGVHTKADPDEIKKAYRRGARTWHPDVCKEPDAAQQFMRLEEAYKVLSAPLTRKKYDFALKHSNELVGKRVELNKGDYNPGAAGVLWKPSVKCGVVKAMIEPQLGSRFVVVEILDWRDQVNPDGLTRVTYWDSSHRSSSIGGWREKWQV